MEVVDSNKINTSAAVYVAGAILELTNNIPTKDTLSYLNGVVVGLVEYAKELKAQSEKMSDEDGLEKLILSWLSRTDESTGLNFTKYIKKENF